MTWMQLDTDLPFGDLDTELAFDDTFPLDDLPETSADLEAMIHKAMRIRAAKLACARRINAQAEDHHRRIDDWVAARCRAESVHAEAIASIEAAIEAMILELRGRSPKTKSVSTPYGTISTRSTERWAWPDDDTLLVWLRTAERGDLIRVTETPDKTAIKKTAVVKDGTVLIDGEAVLDVHVDTTITATFRDDD